MARWKFQVEQEQAEKFPYLLDGIQSKWGSGYNPIVYLDRDGYNLIISTSE
ncbi:hypothetical protein SAMN04487943_106257 [Gracilibacillus orientalis]|uniref:Uncharacterized protein n=1 Tax=Gracilibacillus orientalis TaxID=334253 RepID=A0A1I4MGG6_9BACI|nr:hypothetical protein [Gracilibacillus orientalis]SFM02522.1 hypothetical protein SAMN04487943_106257 [Gracilibacillus orientalis]